MGRKPKDNGYVKSVASRVTKDTGQRMEYLIKDRKVHKNEAEFVRVAVNRYINELDQQPNEALIQEFIEIYEMKLDLLENSAFKMKQKLKKHGQRLDQLENLN